MESFRVLSFCLLFTLLRIPFSVAQLSSNETKILFQVQQLLEYPSVLQGWNNWTNFCYLPYSSSLKIVCTDTHVTELTIIGSKTSKLSANFSIESFFTVLIQLPSLKILSLVSLGLWGPLPAKMNKFSSLQVFNISSNFIYGEIPQEIVSLQNLTSLVMSNNLFNGSVPDLKNLSQLQELNLSGNHLGPNFPSLGNNLVTVILSNNSIRSVIPSEIMKFYQLQKLDISLNKLIGPIPSALFFLPSIQFLDLASNQLTGALSSNTSCSATLKFIDISHNLLIGKLPSCIASSSSNRTVVASWNCLSVVGNSSYQHNFSYCHREALAVKPPSESQEKQRSTIKLGLLLGIIGGVVVIAVVLGLLIFVIIRRSQRTGADDDDGMTFNGSFADKMSVRTSSMRTMDSKRVPQTMRSAAIGLAPYRAFTLEEIEDATNNFDPMNFMGEVHNGSIYKGWLRNGCVVMVKCVKLKQKNFPQSLVQHMEVLSKLRHLHLVSVLGHCIVTYQDHPVTVFVVLEHISNGSLRDYVTDERKKETLKWPQRMAITMGVARGIQFLHTGVAPGIFGNNLKIEHVLLDETLTAKLSNYTIPLPSNKVGSESPLNGDISNLNAEKEDVYQFGVILIQVVTGKHVGSRQELEDLKMQLEKSLGEGQSKLRAMADPRTRGTYSFESLRTTVEITINCLSKDPRNRPSIEDVLWNLQYSNQVQEGWTSSGNLSGQLQSN